MQELMINDRVYNVISLSGRPTALLDRQVAEIYEVETKEINQAVSRNPDKFPEDFCFQLSFPEKELVTNCDQFSNIKHSSVLPTAFTWEGCNMLATILKSDVATKRAIQIIRGFTYVERTLHNSVAFNAVSELESALKIAKFFGLDGNMALISANNFIRGVYDIDCLGLIKANLISEVQEKLYTAAELGKLLESKLSANKVNKLLEKQQLIQTTENGWRMTEAGKAYGKYLVQQIKWYERVLNKLV